MKYKRLVYAESFTAGGQEFVPRRIPAFSRAHVLTPYSLSITVDLDLVSKQNSQQWAKIRFFYNVRQTARCTTLCLFYCGVQCGVVIFVS